MSRQRERHLKRQPTEEAIRLIVTDLVASAGTVDVLRMSYDWRADDVLIQIELKQPLSESTLSPFREELRRRLQSCIPTGDPCEDWLVLVECGGVKVTRLASSDRPDELTFE